jgi:serine/threonine protein kinase
VITVGSRVGGYTVLQELGQGGMGRVYLAQHHRIERRAAIKVLLPELSTNAAVVERFFTEARATSSIRHPGIVEVLDCDVVDSQAFIVMEYLEGESLASYLRRILGLASDRVFALSVVGRVAQAVAAAHARGIVHRDLKPDNVFLCASATDPRVVTKVLDFGIAKLAQQRDAVHTRSGAIMGTPAYMSPEQCRGGNRIVDARSDVYALGCILYETLCGRRPFVREGLGDMILAHVSEAPESLLALVPELPPMLDALAMRMLAKDPRARPQSMADVSTEIIECLGKLGVETPIADIRPIERVILHARGRTPAPGVGAPATPRPPTPAPDGSQGPVPQSATQMGSGGTRLLLSGVDGVEAGGADAADGFDDYAPIPTTFRETAGESMRRAVASPRVRLAVLLGVAAIGGGGAVATFLSRGPLRTVEAVDDGAPTINFAAAETRGTSTSGASRVSEKVIVDVRGLPPGAQIWLDGALTTGLLPLRLPRDDRRHVLSLRASGYEERVVEIDARRDQVVDVVMGPVASSSVKLGAEAREVVRARQAPPARDRTAGPARKRPQKRSDGKSDDTPDKSRDSEAITDI